MLVLRRDRLHGCNAQQLYPRQALQVIQNERTIQKKRIMKNTFGNAMRFLKKAASKLKIIFAGDVSA